MNHPHAVGSTQGDAGAVYETLHKMTSVSQRCLQYVLMCRYLNEHHESRCLLLETACAGEALVMF